MFKSISYILPLILLGCAPKKPDPKNDNHDGSAPVLILDGYQVSLNELNRRIDNLPEFAASKLSTVEAKRAHLTGVAQFEVLALHAARTGFDSDPEVISALKIALQKSHKNERFELDESEILDEIKRREIEIRYGLFFENIECSFEEQLLSLNGSNRLDAAKVRPGARSFSTRTTDSSLSKQQTIIQNLKSRGDYKFTPKEENVCEATILTALEKRSVDRVKVEADMRAQKLRAFTNTLEK